MIDGEQVRRALLLQMAAQRKLTVSRSEIKAELQRRGSAQVDQEALADDLVIQKLRADLTKHVPRPGRAEVEQFYLSNRAQFFQPEQVLAAHIVKNAETPAYESAALGVLQRAEQELLGGALFARVADRYSDCPGNGGSLGWIARGEMVEEFEEVVFSLMPGQRSGIFQTIFGWHIAEVSERKQEGVLPFEEVRHDLARNLFEQRRQFAIDQALAIALQQARVTIAPETGLERRQR